MFPIVFGKKGTGRRAKNAFLKIKMAILFEKSPKIGNTAQVQGVLPQEK